MGRYRSREINPDCPVTHLSGGHYRTLQAVALEWNRRTGENLGHSRIQQIIVDAETKLRDALMDDPLVRARLEEAA